MPRVMTIIATIGTAAMLWVGGNIIVHGLHDLGCARSLQGDFTTRPRSSRMRRLRLRGLVAWAVTAAIDGVIGLALGLLLIPVAKKVVAPLMGLFAGREATEDAAH